MQGNFDRRSSGDGFYLATTVHADHKNEEENEHIV